ncbi:MAG: DUF3318 domain-containing protein [Cyanobacteria bacterium P01_A01_bin.84]
MEPNLEIRRLLNLLPASGLSSSRKMAIKVVNKPEQRKVIDEIFPLPWDRERLIYINFDLWQHLTRQQRDLIFLRTVCWLMEVKWLQLDLNQGLVLVGIIAGLIESSQQDVVGVAVSLGLITFALFNIWKKNKSQDSEINADIAAIRIPTRRGYSQVEAAEYLLSAIETIAELEKHPNLDFIDLIRIQNLRAIAGLSPIKKAMNL